MNYWILAVDDLKSSSDDIKAKDVVKRRIEDLFWGMSEGHKLRKKISSGDKIIFYVKAPKKHFIAEATVANAFFSLSEKEKKDFQHSQSFKSDQGIRL